MKIKLSEIESAAPIRYWKPDISVRSKLSFNEAANRMKEMFLDSVRLHLRSDVPLGVALSGGIDSSSVTCAVRYLEPQADLHTFSYIAKGSVVSEEHYASLVAGRTRAIRHTVEILPEELVRDLDSMIYHLGEPFGSTSIYAQYRVFKLVKQCGIKVALDGQGADELLAGYLGYPEYRIETMLRSGNILGAMKFLNSVSALPGRNRKKIILSSIFNLIPESLKSAIRKIIRRKRIFPEWIDIDAIKIDGARTDVNYKKSMNDQYPSSNKLIQVLAWQLTWNGLSTLLRHGDRNAMAHSIESRVPFLTRDIAEFCLSLPEEYLVDIKGVSKSVFRAAMRGIVPDEVLDRKDKIGFETPEQDWLNAISPWIEETLSGTNSAPYLKISSAKKEWQNIRKGTAKFDWRIWRWINYIRWVEMFKVV
jgi:asparagine synthase (glutamine-hydrolysing)